MNFARTEMLFIRLFIDIKASELKYKMFPYVSSVLGMSTKSLSFQQIKETKMAVVVTSKVSNSCINMIDVYICSEFP